MNPALSRDAVGWTIRDGERVSGGSIYRPTKRTDARPIARDLRIEVQQDEAPACWGSAMNVAFLGHGGLDRSTERTWA